MALAAVSGPVHAETMTDTLQELSSPRPPERTTRPRWGRLLGVTGLVAAVVGTIIIGIAVSRDDRSSSSGALTARQLASIQQTCHQWSGSSASSAHGTTNRAACTAMSDWMTQQLRGARTTGPMMWANATTMRDTCRQWMATGTAGVSGTNAQTWCDDMVSWMTRHIGNWHRWMTNGHMTGR
jgi:hypothetical protein